MKKKIVVGLFVILLMFVIRLDFVKASCILENIHRGDATDQNSVTSQLGAGGIDSDQYCGPYVSYNKDNLTRIFVFLNADDAFLDVTINGTVYDGPGNGFNYLNHKDQYGYLDVNICPKYFVETNKVDSKYNKKLYETTYDDKNGYYEADKGKIVNCMYSFNYNNKNNIFQIFFYKDDKRSNIVLDVANNAGENGQRYMTELQFFPFDHPELRKSNPLFKNFNYWFGDSSLLDKYFNEHKNDENISSNKNLFDSAIKEINEFDYNKCPNIYGVHEQSGFYFFPSKYFLQIYGYDNSFVVEGKRLEENNTAFQTDSTLKKIYSFDINSYYSKFNNCNSITNKEEKNDCLLNENNNLQKEIYEIGNFCLNVYSTCNSKDYITEWCLQADNDILELRKKYNIEVGECGLSSDLISWIANIFKWVKYAAPALVIILSMVEFIKALASQNDDDMKKVQGKFVRRLIAAALLFIIPFLIEFLLDKFNIVSDNPFCNLIG